MGALSLDAKDCDTNRSAVAEPAAASGSEEMEPLLASAQLEEVVPDEEDPELRAERLKYNEKVRVGMMAPPPRHN